MQALKAERQAIKSLRAWAGDRAIASAILKVQADAWDECANMPSRPRLEDNPYRVKS